MAGLGWFTDSTEMKKSSAEIRAAFFVTAQAKT
jgi:hypothetical protein